MTETEYTPITNYWTSLERRKQWYRKPKTINDVLQEDERRRLTLLKYLAELKD